MKKWEYNILSMYNSQRHAYDFDELGKNGWELIAVERTKACSFFYFKREKIESVQSHDAD